MFDSRKLAFVLGAMLVAGTGLYGCEEEQDWGPILDGSTVGGGNNNGGSNGNGGGIVDDGTPADPHKSEMICRDPDKCMTSTACGTKDGIAACMCVTIPNRCRYEASCNGIGSCKYECSTTYVDGNGVVVNTCAWSVCAGKGECVGACNPATLPADGDYDNDGILNGVERDLGASDPCLEDTDGDTIPDGKEDLNHDGTISTEYGETDPSDAASKPGSAAESEVKASACDAGKMLNGENIDLKDLRVARLSDSKFDTRDTFAVFTHNKYNVVGFFGTGSPVTGSRLLKDAIGEGNYIEESNFKSSVPLAAWSKGGIYQENLQIVPNHTVDRYKLTINMGPDDTLESLRNKIAGKVFGSEIPAASGSTKCESGSENDRNKAILYLARSSYMDTATNESMYIYSGALGCREVVGSKDKLDAAAIEKLTATSNIMDDTLSGTLVAPKRIGNTNGYAAFEQFVCQAEVFGESQGSVDFIWVIDNSGSMQDEIDNLTKTVDEFTKRLNGSGIDYRLAVTTTDAYLVDEVGTDNSGSYSYDDIAKGVTYVPYVKNGDTYAVHMNGYFNGLGIHTVDLKYPCMLKPRQLDLFKKNVSQYSSELNATDCTGNLNICGKGYEDGFKSGALVLERLFLDVMGQKPDNFTDESWDAFGKIKRSVAYSNASGLESVWKCQTEAEQTSSQCQNFMDSCMLRTDALKYIIFVSDEDSRQFKENYKEGKLTTDANNTHLYGCLTGYKLTSLDNVYEMAMGMYNDTLACNEPMTTYKEDLTAALGGNGTIEGMSLKEIQDAKPAYYDMLSYYMDLYRKYAGSQSVVAFSLVGDAGLGNGGVCRVLATCAEEKCNKVAGGDTINYTDLNNNGKYDNTECNDCSEWKTDDAGATIGANHGLSYIHLARFLSTVYKDANGQLRNDGQEGGYGSICNTDYNVTVNSIFEDVVGRVAAHPLKGYPVASTIRVSAIINGEAVELKRGDTTTGWRYDASQNAIIFTFANENYKPSQTDHIAISYVIWKKVQG